nr:immunoglobulin light chain junction region [Macaca mulatta]
DYFCGSYRSGATFVF